MTGLLNAAAVTALIAGAIALALHCAVRGRSRTRYDLAALGDLSRGDIDPDWPQVRGTIPGPDKEGTP